MSDRAYFEVPLDGFLPAGLSLESTQPVLVTPALNHPGPDAVHEVFLFEPTEIVLPDLDGVALVLPGSVGGPPIEIFMSEDGVIRLVASLTLRIRAGLLRPLKPGTDTPDETATSVDIALGQVSLEFDLDGNVALVGAAGISLPRCMIGTTGLIVEADNLRWVTASDANPFPLAPGAPGLALDGVRLEMPEALPGHVFEMADVFIGAGGFWGHVSLADPSLAWDGQQFTGAVTGTVLGFPGGVHRVDVELRQSAIVGARVEGDVFLPFLDTPVGVTLGLDGSGGWTASAGPAHSAGGASAGGDQFLFTTGIGNFLNVDVASLSFASGPDAAATLAGQLSLTVPQLDLPPVSFDALRIGADGRIEVEGGWIDLSSATSGRLGGFPLEITRLGLGSEENSTRRWVGLNGTVRLAAGLPAGASVEGLRVGWDPAAADVSGSLTVTLDGVRVEVGTPGAFRFEGGVSFFEDPTGSGFRGLGLLELPSLGLRIDAGLVVGRTPDGDTFFFFHLDVELPTGIPLFTTGTALYGLGGLVADDMGPNRKADEDWYWDWYAKPPRGASDPAKWGVEPGAFAVGLGATIGTAFDDGFTFNTKCLLVLVLPGPRVLLSGTGDFLKKRGGAAGEGAFSALIVLDTPGRLFQANLAAEYSIPVLLDARGNIDLAFSWASPMPPGVWHAYLGQYEPRERRIGATWLKVLETEAWLMVDREGLDLGGWAGIDKRFGFPPVTVLIDLGIGGRGRVSWDPLHFIGELELGGTIDVRAFGIGLAITALATIEAQAPKPFTLRIELLAELEVDLIIKTFRFSTTITLKFGDPNRPLPEPASPIDRVAFEHELARVDLPATPNAPVPPDVRPVVIFRQPVRDPAGIGTPAVPVDDQTVGKFTFGHDLEHIVLRRSDVPLTAAGRCSVDGEFVHLDGAPDFAGAVGGAVTLGDRGEFEITAASNTRLTLDRSAGAPTDDVWYRLRGPVRREAVAIASVGDLQFATLALTLAVPLASGSELAGGELAMLDGRTWQVLAVSDDTVTVAARDDGSEPLPGHPATITAPAPPSLEGSWLDDASGNAAATRLMLWASNPYAWFRSNDRRTAELVEDSRTACGPRRDPPLGCLDLGPELLEGEKERRIQVNTTGQVTFVRDGFELAVVLGPRRSSAGGLSLQFDPPVDELHVEARMPEREDPRHPPSAVLTAMFEGRVVATATMQDGLTSLSELVDEVHIDGSNVRVRAVCYHPKWAALTPATDLDGLPRTLSDHQAAGVRLTSSGRASRDVQWASIEAPSATSARAIASALGVSLDDLFPSPDVATGAGVASTGLFAPRGARPALQPSARLVLEFDDPVTWIRVALGSDARVEAFADERRLESATVTSLGVAEIRRSNDALDRVVISGPAPLRVGRINWDTGREGRDRRAARDWQRSLSRAINRFSDESAVLGAGSYALHLVARTTTVAPDGTTGVQFHDAAGAFDVGPPPGLGPGSGEGYPASGPLADLATYVAATLPSTGARPVYRGDDVGVAFRANYVSRVFLADDNPLALRVVDSGGRVARDDDHNVWGGVARQLRIDEETWVASLHTSGACATIDLDRVARDESITGSGSWLPPERLHESQLRADGRRLFASSFTTSRYGSFSHHLAHASRRVRQAGTGAPPADLATRLAGLTTAEQEYERLRGDLDRVRTHAGGQPTGSDLDAIRDLTTKLDAVVAALPALQQTAFEAVANSLGVDPRAPLPGQPEVVRAGGAFVLQSPEPLSRRRLQLTLAHNPRTPRRARDVAFDRRELGDPGAGSTSYAGLRFDSSLPMRCRGGALAPEGNGTWLLTMSGARLFGLELSLELDTGGHASLSGTGTTVSAPQSSGAGQTGVVTLRLDADALEEARLTATSARIVGMRVIEGAVAAGPSTPVRIDEVRVPNAPGRRDHEVWLTALSDADLTGLSLVWHNARHPRRPRPYHLFRSETLREGERLVVQGGRTQATAVAGARVRTGGTVGSPRASGFSVDLVDSTGAVIDACGSLAPGTYVAVPSLTVIPNSDDTRIILLDQAGPFPRGYWQLTLDYARDAGAPWPVQSTGGDTGPEVVRLALIDD